MKVSKTISRLFALQFTVALLLSQVGTGFFHNRHDAHQNTQKLATSQSAIQEHGEHCKICAIDLITLFVENADPLAETRTVADAQLPSYEPTAIPTVNCFQGRAPPTFFRVS